MGDCDCEKKVVNTEAEAAEEKAVETVETAKKELPLWKRILNSVLRIAALVVILAGLGYLWLREDIKRYRYEHCDTQVVRDLITTMVRGGLGNSGYTFEIAFLSDVELYEITVKDADGNEAGKFRMYAEYNIGTGGGNDNGDPKLCFDQSTDPHSDYIFEDIRRKANARPAAEAPAAEAPAADAPAADAPAAPAASAAPAAEAPAAN